MSWAIGFTTMGRPRIARRFVEVARQRFPGTPLYVADQSGPDPAMSAFYEHNGVRQVAVAPDAGLSASRNRLMEEIAEDYVFLSDDDYLFYRDTQPDRALALLRARPDIAVVGARVFDLAGDILRPWHWEMFLNLDDRNGLLTLVPMHQTEPILRRLGSIRYYLCDAVHNCAVFRRSIFNSTIRWDDHIKINGEHEDFYLTLKLNSAHRVAYLPEMTVFHRPENLSSQNYSNLRKRMDFWRYFRRKWKVNQYLEVGGGLWRIDDAMDYLPAEEVSGRFYAGLDSPQGSPGGAGAFAATTGSALHGEEAPSRRAPTAPLPVRLPILCVPDLTIEEIRPRLMFRYDPVLPPAGDLALWCAVAPEPGADGVGSATLELRARWFDADGLPLVWESSRMPLPVACDGQWRPCWLEVPLAPRGSSFLRFEIVVEEGDGLTPLCCGYVVADPAQDGGGDASALMIEDGSAVAAAARSAAAGPPTHLPAVAIGSPPSGLMALSLEPALEIAALHLEPWPRTEGQALTVRWPASLADRPARVVLPAPAAGQILLRHRTGRSSFGLLPPLATVLSAGAAAVESRRAARDRRVAVVLTSCGRQDLLEQTLASFFAFNTAPIAHFIVMEDGPPDANAALAERYRDVTFLATGRRVGQIAAIDYAYSHVDCPYIFHLEDDWQFYRPGFIENSMRVLEARRDCLQVWLRAFDDTNEHPIETTVEATDGVVFRRMQYGFLRHWHGFSFNPGLRRRADYELLGKYGWFANSEGYLAERCLSEVYKQMGFFAAILADRGGTGYVRHIGWGRTVPETLATIVAANAGE